jgi:peptide/nickel transport system permease protein
MLVAYLRGSLTDRAVMIACTVGQSISILVYILIFQYLLAYRLGWFPVQGWGTTFGENLLRYSALAIIVGVAVSLAPDIRLYRTFLLDEIGQDYVRTARAKGMSEGRVMWVHVLRNAAIPIVTNVLLQLPGLLAGAFLIERFFGIPGIGREVIVAVERSDFPVIKAVSVYVAIATMVVNLVADLLYRASTRGCSSNERARRLVARLVALAARSRGLRLAFRRARLHRSHARRRGRLARARLDGRARRELRAPGVHGS